MNISKIERYIKKIDRGAQVIPADSKQWSMPLLDYLSEGLVNIFSVNVGQ